MRGVFFQKASRLNFKIENENENFLFRKLVNFMKLRKFPMSKIRLYVISGPGLSPKRYCYYIINQ